MTHNKGKHVSFLRNYVSPIGVNEANLLCGMKLIVIIKIFMPKTTPKKSPSPDKQLQKCPTGIKGFDEITEGGLPKNRTTLVSGGADSGKTLLGLDFLIMGQLNSKSPVFLCLLKRQKMNFLQTWLLSTSICKGLLHEKKF